MSHFSFICITSSLSIMTSPSNINLQIAAHRDQIYNNHFIPVFLIDAIKTEIFRIYFNDKIYKDST